MKSLLYLCTEFCMYTSIAEFAAQAVYWLGYELDGPGFETRQEEDMFFFSKTSKQAVVQTQPTVQWELGFFSEVKAVGAWCWLLASSAEVKHEGSYTSAPPLCLHAMDRDSFTFYLSVDSLSRIWCVHTNRVESSRVESNPVQSDSRRRSRDSVAYLQWPPWQCVHTSRVESSRVESSHTSLAESRVVMPHASFSSVRL
jgi:hypothetical protein